MYPNYDGVEDMGLFKDRPSLEAYRTMLLRKTQPQVEFIRKHVVPRIKGRCGKIRVDEVGSGNGRLLISLERAGLLEQGYGCDVSTSRCEFAANWMADLNVSCYIMFDNASVLDYGKFGETDLSVCITGCAQYFKPRQLVRVISLRKDATLSLFELYKPPQQNKFWTELPPEDPFKYYLHEYKELGPRKLLHNKTFIGRDGRIDNRQETLHYYSMGEFLDVCFEAGYKKVHWAVEDSSKFVVLVG